jgi:Uma2 family endonuclease
MPETAERPSTSTVRFTYEDHCLYPDDTKRHEIIDGNEYVAPAPNTFHQRIIMRLSAQMHNHAQENDLGEVFTSPIDLIFSDTDVVQPDVLFVAKERAAIVEYHGLTDAPDLVVEVLSESNRRHDEIRKRRLYERYGVREYWIVDPALEQVKVYRRSDGDGFGEKTEHSREHGGTLDPPLLPGLVVSLEELFA